MKNSPRLERLFYGYEDLKQMGYPWSRVHLNSLVKAGRFPAPVLLSANRIVWRAADLASYAKNLPTVDDAANRPTKRNINGHGGHPKRRERVRFTD